jgi:hypothetical protein
MIYRRDPVPKTGHSGGCWGDYFKTPQTHQERRQAAAYPEFVRSRRSVLHLPDAWEDNARSNIGDHCWKRNKKRRKQWMR